LWGGAGPNSFDCSGLTMMAWGAAGVALDHYAPDQYAVTRRIPIPDLQPGDLVFYGSPSNVYHVGLYVGGGVMIQAPSTGQVVSYSTIYFSGLFAGGRVY
jgi:cell wall-associated NlpC family hydrolase